MKKVISLGIILIFIFICICILILWSWPIRKFDRDPRIPPLQKEAKELKIFEKGKLIRVNAVKLFGFSYFGEQPFIQNDVSFSGGLGSYVIEYKDILIKWKDSNYMKVYYQDSQVYQFDIGVHVFLNVFSGQISSYIRGDWINEFNEMYEQAMKGIPTEEGELKKNWGID